MLQGAAFDAYVSWRIRCWQVVAGKFKPVDPLPARARESHNRKLQDRFDSAQLWLFAHAARSRHPEAA